MFATRTVGQYLLVAASFVAIVAAKAPRDEGVSRFHTRLLKSEPAANDTIAASPRTLRLWFSEQVELPVTSVKLADAAGTAILLAAPARPDTGQSAPVVASLASALPAGSYVVSWSTAAKDGHPAKGTYGFVVKTGR